MTTDPNAFTYTDRIGGTEVVADLLSELREDLVNSLDDAMGKCPHEGVSSEWDLCNACAADTAVKAMRHLLDYERIEVAPQAVSQPSGDIFDQILAVPCPACKAPAGTVCDGRDRRWSHINRRALADQMAERTELCSDKNGFHDGHYWTPDPGDDPIRCPGYPVPRQPKRTCGFAFIGNVGEFTCDHYAGHKGKHRNYIAEFEWTDEGAKS